MLEGAGAECAGNLLPRPDRTGWATVRGKRQRPVPDQEGRRPELRHGHAPQRQEALFPHNVRREGGRRAGLRPAAWWAQDVLPAVAAKDGLAPRLRQSRSTMRDPCILYARRDWGCSEAANVQRGWGCSKGCASRECSERGRLGECDKHWPTRRFVIRELARRDVPRPPRIVVRLHGCAGDADTLMVMAAALRASGRTGAKCCEPTAGATTGIE
mmetsp:Transcript_38855/g.91233  ORF Transcript_38855/g.91233 Transcript_38855/m.91233 type:complete len:214 (+) Transcript_38855:351-992(+)